MEKTERSTVPVRHGFPNPKLSRVLELIRSVPQYRELAVNIRRLAADSGSNDIQLIKKLCADKGIKSLLETLVTRNRTVPDQEPVLGSPPATNMLYGMFGKGMQVTDIGSGNCMKIRRYTGDIKFTCVDPCLRNEGAHVLAQVNTTFLEYMPLIDQANVVLSSWMVLPQLTYEEVAFISNTDGLHLIPDHQILTEIGIAKQEGDKVVVRTINGDYHDNLLVMEGMTVEPGYKLVPAFHPRNINVVSGSGTTVGSYKPKVNAKPAGFYDLNFADVSPKFDGTFVELECNGGLSYLTGRGGETLTGTCDADFHFCLHLEKMNGCYVILRVVQYRGFIPPHYGGGLRGFLAKVKIKIDTMPVFAPPIWVGGDLEGGHTFYGESGSVFNVKTDGIISRFDGSDYYCKYCWTVDLRVHDLKPLRQRLKDLGFLLEVTGDWYPGINELAMVREGAVVRLRPLKPRVDKHQTTTLDTVCYLLDKPTLGDQNVLGELLVQS